MASRGWPQHGLRHSLRVARVLWSSQYATIPVKA